MCTGLELAAAGFTAGSMIFQGMQQNELAKTNAEMAKRQGAADQDAAVAQAEKIRRAAKAQAGQANAALAASGVSVGEGTAVRINEEIYRASEEDAYSTLLTGARRQRAGDEEASLLRRQGRAAMVGSFFGAGGSVLSTGARSEGWKSTRAPIVERSSYAD